MSMAVREANQFFLSLSLSVSSSPLVSAFFFCKKTLVKVNESIGSEKREEVACGGWRLFNGRIAYIESVEGNKTVARWNVVFQSFRHCERYGTVHSGIYVFSTRIAWMFYIDHVTTDACIFAQM